MRTTTIVALTWSILLLSGCASGLVSPAQLTPVVRRDLSRALVPASLGNVSLGYQPQNQMSGAFLLAALKDTLTQSNIFSPDASTLLHVQLVNLQISADTFALDFTARAFGTYRIYTTDGDVFYEHSVRSFGQSTLEEAFLGAERREYAVRRAIAGNLAGFRDNLILKLRELRERLKKHLEQDYERKKQIPRDTGQSA